MSTPPPTRVTHRARHRPATQQPHHRPASPDRTCAAAHCPWDDDYNVLPAIQHLLAATAPHPHANEQTLDPQEPDPPMRPHPVSPAATADQNVERQQKESNCTATPQPLPPPKEIHATLASTLPPYGR